MGDVACLQAALERTERTMERDGKNRGKENEGRETRESRRRRLGRGRRKTGFWWFLPLAVLAVALVAFGGGEQPTEGPERLTAGIADKILRFHVIANSDSQEDQALKLKVRDGVLAYVEPFLADCHGKEQSKAVVLEHMDGIQAAAREVIAREGRDETVSASVGVRYFPLKKYGEFTFPPGEYEALCLELGEARGKNWWCVLYPRLCFVDSLHGVVSTESGQELKTILTSEEYQQVLHSRDTDLRVKSALVEWIRKKF